MIATLLTKDLVTTAFNDHMQFDTDREFDKIEILSISEPFPDPKDASRTCFDISVNIYIFDEENASSIIVEADVYEESYTLYFDPDGCCVQVNEH